MNVVGESFEMSWLQPSLLAVSNNWGCFELESPCDSGSLFPTPWYQTLLSGFWCSSACLSYPIHPDWCHKTSQHQFHPLGSPLLIPSPETTPPSNFCQFSKFTLSPTFSKKPMKALNLLDLCFSQTAFAIYHYHIISTLLHSLIHTLSVFNSVLVAGSYVEAWGKTTDFRNRQNGLESQVCPQWFG